MTHSRVPRALGATGAPRLVDPRGAWLVAGACALGIACAPLVATAPRAAAAIVALVLGLAVVVAVARAPFAGAMLLLVATPLTAGLARGSLVPVLRPGEAILALVLGGLALRGLVEIARGRRVAAHLRGVDWGILALLLTGSLLPLVSMVARGREVTQDDVFYATYLWKYAAVYGVIRVAVRTPRQIRTCVLVLLGMAAIVALVAILQVLNAPGLTGLLATWYAEGDEGVARSSGGSTLSSGFAVADVMVFALALAVGLGRGESIRGRLALAGLALVFVLGIAAAGQVSGFLGLGVGLIVLGIILRRLTWILSIALAVGVAGVVAFSQSIRRRVGDLDAFTGLPASWTGPSGRLDNLQTYFWPDLFGDLDWLTGVRVSPRVPAPSIGVDWVWIESGHTWLLWTGGLLFFVVCFAFLFGAIRAVAPLARVRRDAVGAAALGALTALWVNVVLMALDVHLTLRGSADMAFALLALALVRLPVGAAEAPERPPAERYG